MTSDRAGRDRSFTGKLKLAGEQMLETLVIHDQHDQIHVFDSDLQSPASAANGDECGGAPAISSTASGHTASVLATKDEATLNQVGHDENALRVAQHFFRDAFIRRGHDCVNDKYGPLQAVYRVLAGRTGPGVCSDHAQNADQQQ